MTTTTTDWKQLIVDLFTVKRAMADVDRLGVWEHRLPHVGATEAELLAVERSLGERLDPSYREFLRHAGGWPAVLQTINLFGPDDLMGSPLFIRSTTACAQLDESVLVASSVRHADLMPIGASAVEVDLFALCRTDAQAPGAVIWFADREIERWPDFEEFFRAIVDYNRLELAHLIEKRDTATRRVR